MGQNVKSEKGPQKRYPLSRAVRIAKAVSKECQLSYPSIFNDTSFHKWTFLEQFCKDQKINIILDRKLPGTSKKGVLMYVGGRPFILLDPSVNRKSSIATNILAHEICHVILGHKEHINFSALGFSEALDVDNGFLQCWYQCDIEIEAIVASFLLIMPDAYLHQIIEQSKFIPTKRKSEEHGTTLEWMAARVQLYREMHGYKRTFELMRNDDSASYTFSQPDLKKWENTDKKYLERFFPELGSIQSMRNILPNLNG